MLNWICQLVEGDAIDRAIEGALQLERDAHERGEHPADAERYGFWTDVLQLDLADARRAAVTFNSIDDHTRQVYFALIIEERSIEECVEVGLGDRDAMGETVRSVFRVILDGTCTLPVRLSSAPSA